MYTQLANDSAGVWGAVTSSVDWCEANYQHTPYIAEFFNTLSSLAMVVVGEFGVYNNHSSHWKQVMSFRLISVVGIGSLLFHMTLKYHTQMLDELPMVWTSALVLSLCLEFHYKKVPGWVAPTLFGVTVLATIFTSLSTGPIQVALFRSAFTFLEFSSIFIGSIHYSRLPQSSGVRRMALFGFAMIFLAFLCWINDINRCKELSKLRVNPQLHAVWHILMSVGIYYVILFCVFLHQRRFEALPSTLHYKWGFLPYLKKGLVKL
ncbi:hypothetical protein DSO57_1000967 [Entomophthora muscae]|uniref:Uncharacterized protein n=1 Tax=Entomophthora muscae TaxID=34485 RepID=A0ACC2UHZ3_9FUNG|nr:hypothetical protein DSO57_1000967 [Entomophthora muscae]